MTLLHWLIFGSLILFGITAIIQYLQNFFDYNKVELCKTVGFIIPAFVNVTLSGIFIYIGFQINKGMEQVKQRYLSKMLDEENKNEQQILETEKKLSTATRNMWVHPFPIDFFVMIGLNS
jgi:hypothetical protein